MTPEKRLRLLIIDDSAEVRKALLRLPSLVPGVDIIGEAEDGIEGLALIKRLQPDVVTLDIEMPKMGGIELLEAIKAEGLKCVVIVMTGLTDPKYREQCRVLGAAHVFEKTLDFRKFIAVLRSMAETI